MFSPFFNHLTVWNMEFFSFGALIFFFKVLRFQVLYTFCIIFCCIEHHNVFTLTHTRMIRKLHILSYTYSLHTSFVPRLVQIIPPNCLKIRWFWLICNHFYIDHYIIVNAFLNNNCYLRKIQMQPNKFFRAIIICVFTYFLFNYSYFF